jgi:PKD repeat protein
LTVTGLPSGITLNWPGNAHTQSPVALGSLYNDNDSGLLTDDGTATPGSYTITVTATGDGLTSSLTIPLTVVP